MAFSSIRTTTFVLLVTLAALGRAAAADPNPAAAASPGLAASCRPAAQAEFDFAVAAYRAADWNEVESALARALRIDSECAMAHWLRALALLGTPADWKRGPSPQALARGRLALDHAREAGLRTPRERDHVEALAAMYSEDGAEPRARLQAFEAALARLASRYAEDGELRALLMVARAADCAR